MYSSKVNLPAALNDPRLAKRESDFFTKTWGLDFAETEVMPSFSLPSISRELFGPYLQETAQVTSRPAPGSCSSKDADHVTRVHTFSALGMSCDSLPGVSLGQTSVMSLPVVVLNMWRRSAVM